jgi:hypothetical protein
MQVDTGTFRAIQARAHSLDSIRAEMTAMVTQLRDMPVPDLGARHLIRAASPERGESVTPQHLPGPRHAARNGRKGSDTVEVLAAEVASLAGWVKSLASVHLPVKLIWENGFSAGQAAAPGARHLIDIGRELEREEAAEAARTGKSARAVRRHPRHARPGWLQAVVDGGAR